MGERTYIAIDLKSFYASVECVERGLDPLTTNLVVADLSRTEKTICLAVSPSLKAYGISGRARLFEAVSRVRQVNAERRRAIGGRDFAGSSHHDPDVRSDPNIALDYIVAPPRMALYMRYSNIIYDVYLRYVSPEDVHVYSVDEVFIDATGYLLTYGLSPHDLAMRMILDVLSTTGITATAGIGTNLYLAKIAMDIQAKHMQPDANGVRIAELTEASYRRLLWDHRPLTDFWRIGRGYASKLERYGMYTMGDVARCSVGGPGDLQNEDLLYRLFGVNAELLIDHAWGWEPCTIAQIHAYRPATNSLSSGQVLQTPYTADMARVIVREMAESLALDLFSKGLLTDSVVLTVGYDVENLQDPLRRAAYHGKVVTDRYGRQIPVHSHGTERLERYSYSMSQISAAFLRLYDRIRDDNLLIRRLTLAAEHVLPLDRVPQVTYGQMDLLSLCEEGPTGAAEPAARYDTSPERELNMQRAMLAIRGRYGKNAIFKGSNLEEGSTALQRNAQIGGHQA